MYDTTPLHPPFTMPALCSFSLFTSGDSSLDRATHITVLRSSHSHTLSRFWSGCHPIERQTLSFRRQVMAHGSYPGPHPGPDLGAGHCSPLAAAPAHEVIRGTSAPCGSIRNSSPVVAVRCAWLGCDNTSHWSECTNTKHQSIHAHTVHRRVGRTTFLSSTSRKQPLSSCS